jgi:hypothetical protein
MSFVVFSESGSVSSRTIGCIGGASGIQLSLGVWTDGFSWWNHLTSLNGVLGSIGIPSDMHQSGMKSNCVSTMHDVRFFLFIYHTIVAKWKSDCMMEKTLLVWLFHLNFMVKKACNNNWSFLRGLVGFHSSKYGSVKLAALQVLLLHIQEARPLFAPTTKLNARPTLSF